MIPSHYFEIICCPKCKSNLDADSKKEQLICPNCKLIFPVVDGKEVKKVFCKQELNMKTYQNLVNYIRN